VIAAAAAGIHAAAMNLGIAGKRAFVSGSTAGIGLAVARALAREGAVVYLNGRTRARVDAALAAIGAQQPDARLVGVAADLGSAEGVGAAIEQLPELDILVNNLGIFEARPFAEIGDGDWQRLFETNVMSGVRLARRYLPQMLARGEGRIIFVSSESAVQIPAEMIHYGMTKSAQVAVARGLAELTVGTRVTVNTVLAGPTRSEGVAGFVSGLARQMKREEAAVERDFFETARPSSLLKRFIEPDEVANLVVYLSSAAASATNGAALRVDGGVVRAML
jgi:NAD(P)-dependent dehydrogenase (short-subunit alcohol dehydrogenase family)